ncbi:MAG TPA: hypothetical protein VGR56_08565 [Nitrososphaerales archaeon]|nr:hypothetical protein [Nitrososphaerales archaeon]
MAEKRTEEMLDRLLLEAKGISLLLGTDAELKAALVSRLLDSHDESVRRFVRAMQTKKPAETGRLLAIAIGELVIASFLVLAGTVVLVPSVVGINSYAGLVQYLSDRASTVLGSSPLSQYLPFIEFGVGVVLMLSAFFSLREAALNLRQAGLSIRTGES